MYPLLILFNNDVLGLTDILSIRKPADNSIKYVLFLKSAFLWTSGGNIPQKLHALPCVINIWYSIYRIVSAFLLVLCRSEFLRFEFSKSYKFEVSGLCSRGLSFRDPCRFLPLPLSTSLDIFSPFNRVAPFFRSLIYIIRILFSSLSVFTSPAFYANAAKFQLLLSLFKCAILNLKGITFMLKSCNS